MERFILESMGTVPECARYRSSSAASVAGLAFPAGAAALIQPDRGIAGARLGNTKAEVRAALGKPGTVVKHGMNDFGPFTVFRYRGAISVTFQGNRRVTSVTTKGRGDRTVARRRRRLDRRRRGESRVRGIACETFVGLPAHATPATSARATRDHRLP